MCSQYIFGTQNLDNINAVFLVCIYFKMKQENKTINNLAWLRYKISSISFIFGINVCRTSNMVAAVVAHIRRSGGC